VADEYDWKIALDAVFDTEMVNSAFNAAVGIVYLFIQGQREALDLAWDLSRSWADIESGKACTMDVVADVVLGFPSSKLFPDDVQKVAVIFDQTRVAGNEEDQDAFVSRIRDWRRNGILDLVGTEHRRRNGC
jgi:hypothetical protein